MFRAKLSLLELATVFCELWLNLQKNNSSYVNYLRLEFLPHFTHCHFHSSQLQLGKKERCRVMMQCPAISHYCVMLLALLSFLEFPPFSYATHIFPKTQQEAQEVQSTGILFIHQKKLSSHSGLRTVTWGSQSSCSCSVRLLPGWQWCAVGVRAGCFPLCWWLALAGLRLAVAVDQTYVM